MGSEDLFHKRKARTKRSLERERSKREPYEKILIVCEGSKSEPYYFEDAKRFHKINTLNIKVEGTGLDPNKLVERTEELVRQEARKGDRFDAVYCVFDKDQHTSYQQAINRIHNTTHNGEWFAITSVPCFEYWLILHFAYTDKPFYDRDDLSAAEAVTRELKQYFSSYSKEKKSIYTELYEQVPKAIGYAKRILKSHQNLNTDNPSTHIHILVERIQNIKT